MERRAGVDGTSARKTGTLNSSSDSNKVNCFPYFFRPIARGEYKNVYCRPTIKTGLVLLRRFSGNCV